MRIFTGFLIMLCSVVLWFLPVSESIYAWQTDPRTDTFQISTGIAATTGSAVLLKPIYDNDTSTILFSSNLSADVPVYVSYNTTSRLVGFGGLSDNGTRALAITYDFTAFAESPTLTTVGEAALWLTYVLYVLFPVAGIVYIFWEKWFG